MITYYRKHLINYQFLLVIGFFLISQLFLTFGLSKSFASEDARLFANEYNQMYQERLLYFSNFLLIILCTIIIILSHRKTDLPITIYFGKIKMSLARYIFNLMQITIIFLCSFATLIIFSTLFVSYFTTTLPFALGYAKLYINLIILFAILQIFIRWDNKLIAPLITGTFMFITTIITDFEKYVPIYKYLFPISGITIYQTMFGYLYLFFYIVILFLVYILIKKSEQLKG